MTFAIIFVLVFVALGIFAIYLSRTVEHGEAQFDTRNRDEAEAKTPVQPRARAQLKGEDDYSDR